MVKANLRDNQDTPVRPAWQRMEKLANPISYRLGKARALQLRGQLFLREFNLLQAQQNLETPLHKVWVHNLQPIREQLPEAKEQTDQIVEAAAKRRQKLADAASAAIVPVKHTIKIESK